MNYVFTVQNALRIVQSSVKNISIRFQSTKKKLITFYDVLNLKPGCSKKEIRNSFIKLSKLNHPDVCGPSSTDKFVSINEAYNVLSDENKKKLYDETLRRADNSNSIYYHYPRYQSSGSWKAAYNNPSNHWLSSSLTIAGFCALILVIGSAVQIYGVKKSSSMRSSLIDDSNERFAFLEEKDLMKVNKTNDELIQIFEENIIKEYGQTVQK